MLERTTYPVGIPCWVDTAQPDVDAAVGFYSRLFGWQFEDTLPPDAQRRYCVARLRGARVAAVGSARPDAPQTSGWNTYVRVDSAEDTAATAVTAGGAIVTASQNVGEAGRVAVLADPSGAVLGLWQPDTITGAQLVNEPGAWNWSNLVGRDIARTEAFYRQVFGWEATPVDFSSGKAWMWRMPGYADFLEQIYPGIRQRHGDAGAPAGFTDAIGWLQPLTGDQVADEAPPHWAVTFAVDDADTLAERARRLGGTVTIPPVDVAYARIAVLTDPQGASFTVCEYNPPT